MKLKHLLFTAFLFIQTGMVFGQKIKVSSGNLDFLENQKNINIVYDYSNMGVGKYDREEDYVYDRVEKMNSKEPGKGDEWREAWIADRTERFAPKFEELINKSLEKKGVRVGDFENAEYTMIVETTFTEPGFNVGVARKNAYTDMDVVFVKTGTNDPIAVVSITKSPGRGGMGYDFDTGYRIQESYAKAGKELGKFLGKKAL